MKIGVAMSGGVDSCVAALLLKRGDHEVFGLHMKLFDGDRDAPDAARAACGAIGIEFALIDLREEFRRDVQMYFAREYAAGRTPNPCVRCNPKIKFGALLKRASKMGADAMATGHYVRKKRADDKWQLLRGVDPRRDQSYFLYTLGQGVLDRVEFPLGEYKKDEVKKIAAEAGLPAAERDESREICFVPDDDYVRVVEELLPGSAKPGNIVNEDGEKLGEHSGIINYTVGQRRGMGVSAPEPLYVVELRTETDEVVAGYNDSLFASGVMFEDGRFVSGAAPEKGAEVQIKIRYNARPAPAKYEGMNDGIHKIIFAEKQRAVTPGQAAVLYRGDEVLGGGTIVRAIK